MPNLIPVRGCYVALRNSESIGQVMDVGVNGSDTASLLVKWIDAENPEWLPVTKFVSGFRRGMDVQDVPRSRVRRSLGAGKIVSAREIGREHQVLVDFPETGQQLWLGDLNRSTQHIL